MKKITSLVLAMVSAMLLVAGATQAAEKLDPLAHSSAQSVSNAAEMIPGSPCAIMEPPHAD